MSNAAEPFSFFVPTRCVLGRGILAGKLGELASRHGQNVLLVSGRKHREMGVVDQAREALEAAGLKVAVFTDVEADPSTETVEAARDIALARGAQVVVGLGGGSANDAAKGAAIGAKLPGGIWQYAATQTPGKAGITDALPMISVPTTSGTGTETTPYSVITNRRTCVKDTLVSEHIMPKAALIDVDLLVTMPPALTAGTGLDAFCQAMESFLSTKATPATDALAEAAMRIIVRYLPRAYADGSDGEARTQMAVGSLLSGAAIAHNGCIAPHAFAHAIGGHCHVHHGTAVALVTPAILEYNLPEATAKCCRLAEIYALPRNADPDPRYAARAVERTRDFFASLDIPPGLAAEGVRPEHIPPMTKDITNNISLQKNPRPMTAEDIQQLLEKAM